MLQLYHNCHFMANVSRALFITNLNKLKYKALLIYIIDFTPLLSIWQDRLIAAFKGRNRGQPSYKVVHTS